MAYHSGVWHPRFLVTVGCLFVAPALAVGQSNFAITQLSPSSAVAGGPGFTLAVTGTGFFQNSQVIWRYNSLIPVLLTTTWVSPTRLEAQVPADLILSAGFLNVAVRAVVDGSVLFTNSLGFNVLPGLAITSCPLPDAVVNRQYSQTLGATGGSPPYTWSVVGGSLPSGITLSSDEISGTPTVIGNYAFDLRVQDAQERSSTKACTLRVVAAQPGGELVIESLLPNQILAGSAPTVLEIKGTGFGQGSTAIWDYGTAAAMDLPTVIENDTLLRVTVSANLLVNPAQHSIAVRRPSTLTAPPQFSNVVVVTVVERPLITTPCPLAELTQGQQFTLALIVTGGFGQFTWDIETGTLTNGLTLASNGTLSGRAGTPGLYQFTLRATDSQGNRATKSCSQSIVGPLVLSATALRFDTESTGAPPPPQDLGITAQGGHVQFTFNVATQTPGNWLRAAATALETPAAVRVVVDPAGLPVGTHRGTVAFTSQRGSGGTLTVNVELRIAAPQPARLGIAPSALRFTFPRGATGAARQLLKVLNQGTGSIAFTAEAAPLPGGGTLSVTPASGNTTAASPANLRVTLNPAGLSPGVYRSRITLRAGGTEILVPVAVAVSTSPESMTTSQNGMVFTVASGGAAPPPRPVEVLANGTSGFFWETSTSVLAGGDWLHVVPPSNSSTPGAPSGTSVEVDPTGLPPDLYFGEVQVRAAVDNSPRLLSVVLQVLNPGVPPPPSIEPGGLVFTANPGGALPPVKTITVRNLSTTSATLAFAVNNPVGASVFSAGNTDPVVLPAGGAHRIEVLTNTSRLVQGAYRGSVAIQMSTDTKVRLVDLLAVVGPGIPTSAEKEPDHQAADCVPTRLVPVVTSHTSGFGAPTGLPLPLETRVLDDCGDPMTEGAVIVSLSPGAQAPVALVHLGSGRWSGTLQVQGSAGPVTAALTADDPIRNLQGSFVLTGEVTATDGVPVISDGGVVSAASFAGGAPLAPGGIFSVFGQTGTGRLADGSTQATTFPVPTQLGSTRVAIAGREVPLYFAGEQSTFSQVNAMLPFDLVPNASYQLSVRRGNRRSNYAEVILAASQPYVFTADQSGSGQGIIVDGANQTVLVNSANPIPRGGVVVIYLEGLGAVNRGVVPGDPSPASPPAQAVASVTVTIGGQPSQILFAGLTPGLAGLFQINATVAETVTPGNAVPVVVTAGGQTSVPVTIAVR